MIINYIPTDRPVCKSFTVFSKPDYQLLRETKTVEVTLDKHTKTTITTDIQWGSYCGLINLKMEGYKFHETTFMNYFWGEQQERIYFKVSKKQGKKEYMECLTKALEKMFGDKLEELTVHLIDNYFVG